MPKLRYHSQLPKLMPGDICATRGSGFLGFLSREILLPRTDRFHFFLVYLPLADDVVIIESIGKGVCTGSLMRDYKGVDLEIYRMSHESARQKGLGACQNLLLCGRYLYDYILPFRLALGLLRVWQREGFHRVWATHLHYYPDTRFICTEAVDYAWKSVEEQIVPPGICPLPQTFKQAEERGIIVRIF